MVRIIFIAIISIAMIACDTPGDNHTGHYFHTINQAELQITQNEFQRAAESYEKAFELSTTPFGKDIYNAIIINSEIGDKVKVREYLQVLVNKSEDISFIESTLVGNYISNEDFNKTLKQRKISYNESLRNEMERIKERDQEFRPLYDTHMDTIENIRKDNLEQMFEFSTNNELPGHQEIGYSSNLRNQPHHIVLYHTAQRRSQDKNVESLDSILKQAVTKGKIDPEQAIMFLKYQNDPEAGPYEVYTIYQIQHSLLPDSLQLKLWKNKTTEEEMFKADSVRKEWLANTFDELSTKAEYLKNTSHPFIFSGIYREISRLPEEFSERKAMEQYEGFTSRWVED